MFINKNKSISDIIQKNILSIDHLLNMQINIILHDACFQKLEATWRGLFMLVTAIKKFSNNFSEIKIKLLNISWKEIQKDITHSLSIDQTQLFRMIYSDEFGSPGGEPYGLLIGDYEIGSTTSSALSDDLELLSNLSKIASAAFSPFIAMVNSDRVNTSHFLASKQEEMRFIGLVLPKIIQRLPYRINHHFFSTCAFNFREKIEKSSHYLWGSLCYAFGIIVARAFAQSGWFADIQGMPYDDLQGGKVDFLPAYYFPSDKQKITALSLTKVCLLDQQEKILANTGLIALCHCKYTDFYAFYNCPSLYQPQYQNQNQKLSSSLNYILCISRFAHYLKIIARNKLGALTSAHDCEKILNKWLRQYTAQGNTLTPEMQVKYPLRESRVEIIETPEHPGAYICRIYISPHYRFEQIEAYLQFMTQIC